MSFQDKDICTQSSSLEKLEHSDSSAGYDSEAKDLIPPNSITKTLDLLYTKSYLNLRIQDQVSERIIYYVDNSCFTRGKPDVTLVEGSEKEGLVLGVCRWSSMFSKHFNVGIGDPLRDENATNWEEVRTDTIIHPEFEWGTGPPGNRATFAWHRIGSRDLQDEDENANRFSRKSFKLVNCADGEVLAVLASHRFKSWNKLGRLIIKADGVERGWGKDWEVQSLLSLLGVVEMSRRRGRHRRSQGGAHG